MTRLRDFFKAFDPGLIRLEHTLKAGLAIFSAAVASALVILGLLRTPAIQAIIFSFMVTFMCFMLVNDVQPGERRRTMLLVALIFAVAPFVVGIIQASPLVVALLLLTAMFVSFYVRRYGRRAAELGASAVMAAYFSWLFGATLQTAPLYALGAAIGIGAAYVWTFVIRPYNPRRNVMRALRAFDESAAGAVGVITRQLASVASAGESAAALKRVHTSRRVIEIQLAAVTGTTEWTRERIGQLRVVLFDAEQGLERMAESTATLVEHRALLPEGVRIAADQALAALDDALTSAGSPEQMSALRQAGAQLADQARAGGDDADAWKPALLTLGSGASGVAQAIHGVRRLVTQPHPAQTASPEQQPVAQAAAAPPQPRGLHPTTRLGIQAVVACGAAMVVAGLLNLDRPYWAFWTAYIVVAGPIGESLQKLIYRVIGTTLGAFFGTLLVLVLPADPVLLITLQILAMMLALYTSVINYSWVVFWITTFVALMYSVEGVPPATLLVERPINTLIGAIVAAVVVWFVFPIRERGKFSAALVRYLAATDAYLRALVDSLQQVVAPAAVTAAGMQASGAFEALAATFSSLALEYSPLAHARSPLTRGATLVASLHADVNHFAGFVTTEGDAFSSKQAAAIQTMQGTIHHNIELLQHQLAGPSARPGQVRAAGDERAGTAPNAVDDAGADGNPRAGVRAVAQLSSINQTIVELDASLSADEGVAA